MAKELLNKNGLSTLISSIKSALSAKADSSSVPTKISQLTNDSGYQTSSQVASTVSTATAGLAKASSVPTKVSQITNDSKFQTEAEVNSAIAAAVGKITGFSAEVVAELPATGKDGVIYLIKHEHSSGDTYDEYLWISSTSTFEKIGNTDIDLSAYATKTQLSSYATTSSLSAYLKTADVTEITSSDVTKLWNETSAS